MFFITVTKSVFRKKDASLFSVRLVGRNKRVKALKESMPCESLMASIKSTHSDSLISWNSPKSFTFYIRNKFYFDACRKQVKFYAIVMYNVVRN